MSAVRHSGRLSRAAAEEVLSTGFMSALAAFLYASALLTPTADSGPAKGSGPVASVEPEPNEGMRADPMSVWRDLIRSFEPKRAAQVRIEQHVIMRISPRPGVAREGVTALAPIMHPQARLEERDMDGCVPLGAIAAVQPRGESRLLLYLRDRTLVAAELERSCSARDFYSGFYVERSSDGRLCPRRDKVLSRSGARCELSGFHRLVVASD